MKPIIGFTMNYKHEDDLTTWNNHALCCDHYLKVIESAGGLPIMLPRVMDEQDAAVYCGMCDGFLFTGGGDWDPSFYGEARQPQCGASDPVRDAFELALFRQVFAAGKPILGICRGIQTINVALGGTLHQDIPDHAGTVHEVCMEDASLIRELAGCAVTGTNSFHHQAVKKLADGLRVTAYAQDRTVEAVEYPGYPFLLGIQWHPEVMWVANEDPLALAISRAFVDACASGKGR